tara:strand:+ start:2210 stop:6241 length:4032 start_codon:yes stop_codon:yes gene_type:complete
MAEVKNNFIKSKMNKDLDRRLIPSGEYINAINSQISMSEGDGVGTLENMLGNELVATLVTPAVANLISIGYYVDQINNFIYIFLTDNYTASYVEEGGGIGENHFICRYNASNNTTTTLVKGAFLNFSTLNPIYGVNLLENLLFFTDNRNQPRKINVTNAANDATYYTTEDQISVAKYNPYDSIYLYEPSAESSLPTNPYQSTMKDVVSKFMPTGGSAAVAPGAGGTGTSFNIINGLFPFYPNKPAAGQTIGKIPAINPNGPIVMLGAVVDPASTSSNVVLSTNETLADNDQLIFFPNPYYDNTYSGDSEFLEDKFVRFSYRFKFEDNEYSLIAPFTQSCFIPKQDGYFLTTGLTAFDNDQTQAAESSIVSFMENKVNSIGLQIPLPVAQTALFSDLKITEIEVLYKESDGLAIKAVDTIDVSTLASSDNFIEYLYVGKKPFKTLLEKETARVFDKVPVKSLAQEVSGNRVIYSNFQNRHTPPASLDYNVSVGAKSEFDLRTGSGLSAAPLPSGSKTINLSGAKGTIIIGSKVSFTGAPPNLLVQSVTGSPTPTAISVNQNVTIGSVGTAITFTPASNDQNTTSRQEYPSSSLKTNRSYQVGVVLSDRFGRTSDVILSNNNTSVTLASNETFSGASLYSPYIAETDAQAFQWPGNALKVLFNSVIGPENPSGFYPGIYNGTVTDPNYNPLGWYSYKIVVQQKEQEYYNVYAPGAIKGDIDNELTGGTTALNMNTSRIILINDNINKVPRDLSEVGPQDKTFRSSVQLIGRVVNNIGQYRPPYSTGPTVQATAADSNLGNQQYYPDTRTFTTNTIQPLFDNQDWPNGYLTGGPPASIPPLDNTQPIFSCYAAETNPFVAEITTSQLNNDNFQFGVVNPFYSAIGTGNMRYVPVNQLCVLETEPVTSLLDIFYETSTSGLINDLNTSILNDIGISDSLFNFNFALFNEGIAPNGNISSLQFTLVDQFNVQLLQGTAVGEYTTFTLTAAEDAQDNDISLLSYFNLVPSGGGPGAINYNVQVTSAFVNNVYFGNNIDARNFTLTFVANIITSVGPIVTEPITFTEQIFLANVVPDIYKNKQQPPAPADSYFPPGNVTVNKSPNDLLVLEVYGRNGANTTSNPNTELDLTWSIESVTNAITTDPIQQPFPFGLETAVVTTGAAANLIESCKVKNLQQNTIKAGEYDINLQLADAGNAVKNLIIKAIFGTPPTSVVERNYIFNEVDNYPFVEVYFDSPGVQNGWYIYSGSWDGNSSNVNDIPLTQSGFVFGNNINVSGYVNALITTTIGENNFYNRWWWSGSNAPNARDAVRGYIESVYDSLNSVTTNLEFGADLDPGAQNGAGYGFTII